MAKNKRSAVLHAAATACLFFLLSLALFVVAPKACAAAGTLTQTVNGFGNNGYPYGKIMSSSNVIMKIDYSGSRTVQWQTSSSENGSFSDVPGATGTEWTCTSVDVWVRAKVGTSTSKAIKVIKPTKVDKTNSSSTGNYYLTNGRLAYTFYLYNGSNYHFDTLAYVDSTVRATDAVSFDRWIKPTYSSTGWWMHADGDSPKGAGAKVDGAPSGTIDWLKGYFNEGDTYSLFLEIKLNSSKSSFAFGADTQLDGSDSAPMNVYINSDGTFKQIQMVATSDNKLGDSVQDYNTAFVVRATDTASRNATHWYASTYSAIRKYESSGTTSHSFTGDSGLALSWANVGSGAVIPITFSMGSVEQTGAATAANATAAVYDLTITPTANLWYQVQDPSGNIVGTFPSTGTKTNNWFKPSSTTDFTVTGLNQNTWYTVLSANNSSGGGTSKSKVQTGFDPDKNGTAAISVTTTANSLKFTGLNTSLYYKLLKSDNSSDIQTGFTLASSGTLTFTGLSAGTTYYLECNSTTGQSNQISLRQPHATSTLTITYSGNGNTAAPVTNVPSSTTINASTKVLTSSTPTRYGYSFQGWATTSSGSVAYAAGANVATAFSGNTTLYAVWSATPAGKLLEELNKRSNGSAKMGSGEIVILQSNVTLTSTLAAAMGTYTLNLNGKTLTGPAGSAALSFSGSGSGTLTLSGSGGKIVGPTGSPGASCVSTTGNLIVDTGVTLQAGDGAVGQAGGNGINVCTGGLTITVKGTVLGGNGGSAVNSTGKAGAGGHGINFVNGSTYTGTVTASSATVKGGNGGMAISSANAGAAGLAVNPSSQSKTGSTFTNGSTGTVVSSSAYSGVYDGAAHSITVTAAGATITYSTSENGTYSSTLPTRDTVGSTTVYYQAKKSDTNFIKGSAAVTLTQKPLTVNVTATSRPYSPGNTNVALTASLVDSEICTRGGTKDAVSVTVGTGTVASDLADVAQNINNLSSILSLTGAAASNYKFNTLPTVSVNFTKADQAAPTAPSVSQHETVRDQKNGILSGVTSEMEYRSANTSTYTAGTGADITGLAAGTYYVRYKLVSQKYNASPDQTLVINAGTTLTVTFDSDGGSEVSSVTGLTYQALVTAPTDPSKKGYNFLRWVDSSGGAEWLFATSRMGTQNVTLRAVWEENTALRLKNALNTQAASVAELDSPGTGVILQNNGDLSGTVSGFGGATKDSRAVTLEMNGFTLTSATGKAALAVPSDVHLTLHGAGTVQGRNGTGTAAGAPALENAGELTISAGVSVLGGDGGMEAGKGGNGVTITGNNARVTIAGTVQGGRGGSAQGHGLTGTAGAGGNGIDFTGRSGGTVSISGSVRAGDGGMATGAGSPGSGGSGTVNATVTSGTAQNGAPGAKITSADVDVTYDRLSHSIALSGVPTGATVTYATAESGPFTSENPAFTLADQGMATVYTTYYKIELGTNNLVWDSKTVTIRKKALTVSVNTVDRVYEPGRTTVELTNGVLSGVVPGDDVTPVLGAATLAAAPVATAMPASTALVPGDAGTYSTAAGSLTTAITLGGADCANYSLSAQPSGLTVTVSKAERPAIQAGQITPTAETFRRQADGLLDLAEAIGAVPQYWCLQWQVPAQHLQDASGNAWTDTDLAQKTGLKAGTYYFRYKETTNYLASPALAVVVGEGGALSVTFDSNGGSAVADVTNLDYAARISAPAAPTKHGYNFLWWVRSDAPSTQWDFTTDTVTTAGIRLLAVWEDNTARRLMDALNAQAASVAELDAPGTGVVLRQSAALNGTVSGFGGATNDSRAVTLTMNGFTLTSAAGKAALAVPSDVHLTLTGNGTLQGAHGANTAAGAPALENAGRLTIDFGVIVYGGNGGMEAGKGGNGITITGNNAQVTVQGTVLGGMGGSAQGHGLTGTAGAGGHGLDFTGRTGGTVSISGTVRGGDGGMATGTGAPGNGGNGVVNAAISGGTAQNGAQGAKITSADVDAVYDGADHFITVSGVPAEGNLVYWSSSNGEHQTANPGFKLADQGSSKDDVTVYTVYYQVSLGANNLVWDSKTITLRKKALTVSVDTVDRVYEIDRTTVDLSNGVLTGVVEGDTVAPVLDVADLTGPPQATLMAPNTALQAGDAGLYSTALGNLATHITLSGTDCANYYLSAQPANLTVTVTKAARPPLTNEQVQIKSETYRRQADGSLVFLSEVFGVHQYARLQWRTPASHLEDPTADGAYSDIVDPIKDDLLAGTYYVRYKETTNYQASPALQLVIPEGAALSVTFDSDGGSDVAAVTNLDYNARIDAPEPPTKHGYNFLWWVRSDDTEVHWDFALDTVTTAGIQLKAVWEDNTARRLMDALNGQCAGIAELNDAGTGVNLVKSGTLSGTAGGFDGALNDPHDVGLNLAGYAITSPEGAPALSVPAGVHLTLTAGSVLGKDSIGSNTGATAIETAGTLTVGTGASVGGGNGGIEAGLGGTAIRAVGSSVTVEVASGASVTGGNGGSAVNVNAGTLAADGGIGIDFTGATGGRAQIEGSVTGGIGGAAAGEATAGRGGLAVANGTVTGSGTAIPGADGTKVSGSGYHGVYDGDPHAITVHAAAGTVAYSTQPGGPYTFENPTFTDVGSYTVYYRVTLAPANIVYHQALVTITEKDLPVTVEPVNRDYIPGDRSIELLVSVKDADLCSQLGVLDDVRPVSVPGTVPSEYAIGDQTVTITNCIRLEGEDAHNYRMVLPLTVKAVIRQAPQAAPTAAQVYVTRHETILYQADGVITGVSDKMEYRYANSSESQYTDGTGADLTNLPNGSYFVRFKEVPHQYNASPELEVPMIPGRTLSAAFDSDGGTTVATVTGLTYNVTVPAPAAPTKHGYNFLYWVLEGSSPEKIWDFTSDTVTDDDITLRAVWEENTARRLMNAINDQSAGAAVLDASGLQVHLTRSGDLTATLQGYDGATRDDHSVLLDLENYTLTGAVGLPVLEVPETVTLTLQDGTLQGRHGAGTADGAAAVTAIGTLKAESGTLVLGGNGGLEAGNGGNAVNAAGTAIITVDNGALILGGTGGSAAGNGLTGAAGTGGDGISAEAGAAVTITGTVRGGNGGMAGDLATPGRGGLGVRGVDPQGAAAPGLDGALITSQGVLQTYDSLEHTITVFGQPEGSSTAYWAEGVARSPENPAFRMAGAYQVFYRVTLGDNNLVESSNTITLERKDLTLTLLPEQRAYLPADYSVKWLGAALSGNVEGDDVVVTLTHGLVDDVLTDAQGHTARYHYDHTDKTHNGLALALSLPGEDQDSAALGVTVTGSDRPNYILHWTPVEVVITKANREAVQYVNVETMPETAMHRGDGKITIHTPIDTVEMKGPAADPNGVPGEFIDFTSLLPNAEKDISLAADGSVVVEWLPMGTYTIRYQEDENYFTSPEIEVILAEGTPHEVIYDGNGLLEPVTLKKEHIYGLPEGSTLEKPEDPFQRGYNFIGWTTDPEGTQPWVFEGEAEEPDQVLHPLTLYAQWEESASRILMDRLNAQLPDAARLNQDGSAVLLVRSGEVASPVVPDDGTLVHYGTTAVSLELNGFTLSSPAADTTQPVFTIPANSTLTLSGGTVRGSHGGLGIDGAPAVRSQGGLVLANAATLTGGNGGISGGSGGAAIEALSGSVTIDESASATGGSGGSASDSTAGSQAGAGGDGIRLTPGATATVLGTAQGGSGGLAAGLATAGVGGEGVTGRAEDTHSRNGLTRATITAENVTTVYDGENHSITVEHLPEDPGTLLRYWSSENAVETDQNPQFKLSDRGADREEDTVYRVYYRVALGNNNRVQYHADITISKAPLTVAAAAVDRVYEKDRATVSLTGGALTGVVSGDVVGVILGDGTLTAPPQATLLPPNKALVIGDAGTYASALGNLSTAIALTGPDCANYYLTQQPDDLTVQVTKAPRDAITMDQVTVTPETRRTQADGAITLTGVELVPEYGQLEWLIPAVHNDDPLETGTFTLISEALAPDLKAGAYYIRYRETTNYQASAPIQVHVPEGRTLVVTFDPQDGEMADPVLLGLDYGKPISAPEPPARKGYNFAGWAKDTEGKQAWGFGVDPVLEDMTLYAKWSRLPIYEVSGTLTDSEGNGAGNIKVVLTQGTTVVDSRITDDDGDWVFETPSGVYNVVVYLEDPDTGEVVKYTELVDLKENILRQAQEAAKSAVITIDLPDGGEQGILVTDNAGAFEETVAGGLQDEAHLQRGGRVDERVTVTLTVTEEEDLTVRPAPSADSEEEDPIPEDPQIEAVRAAESEVKRSAGGRTLQFFDLDLTRTVIRGNDSENPENVVNQVLHESMNLLSVVLPFQRGSRQNIAVFRYHQSTELDDEGQPAIDELGNVKTFWETQSLKQNPKLDSDTGEPLEEGFVVESDSITLYVDKFSLYAIGYSTRIPYYYSAPAVTPAPADEPKTAPSEPEPDVLGSYTDIFDKTWYYDGVSYVIHKKLMQGYNETTFAPFDLASRAMIATIVWNMEGSPESQAQLQFDDVSDTQWFATAARWTKDSGIVEGISSRLFAPNKNITRQQLVTILYRYAIWKGIDVSGGETVELSAFEDADQVAQWARPAMQWAVGAGLVKGRTDTTLEPRESANRAEIACLFMRFCTLVAVEKEPAWAVMD